MEPQDQQPELDDQHADQHDDGQEPVVEPFDQVDLEAIELMDVDAEEARLRELFADPRFAEAEAARRAVMPIQRGGANGSVGRALALGFANVFDPDRQHDEVQAIQERGDDDPDAPSLDLDKDNPKSSRITIRGRRSRSDS